VRLQVARGPQNGAKSTLKPTLRAENGRHPKSSVSTHATASVVQTFPKGLPIRFLGQLAAEQAQAEIARARLQILPSESFEGFTTVVREAFAFGTPSAVSDLGPMPSIVTLGKSGIVFQPANPQSLLQQVRTAWETPGLLETLGENARAEFETK